MTRWNNVSENHLHEHELHYLTTNCLYNNVAKGIRLLDKSIFVYTGKKMHARAFESFPLNRFLFELIENCFNV